MTKEDKTRKKKNNNNTGTLWTKHRPDSAGAYYTAGHLGLYLLGNPITLLIFHVDWHKELYSQTGLSLIRLLSLLVQQT